MSYRRTSTDRWKCDEPGCAYFFEQSHVAYRGCAEYTAPIAPPGWSAVTLDSGTHHFCGSHAVVTKPAKP